MGCVTWLERYFADRNLGQENFDAAEKAAREVLRPVSYTHLFRRNAHDGAVNTKEGVFPG